MANNLQSNPGGIALSHRSLPILRIPLQIAMQNQIFDFVDKTACAMVFFLIYDILATSIQSIGADGYGIISLLPSGKIPFPFNHNVEHLLIAFTISASAMDGFRSNNICT